MYTLTIQCASLDDLNKVVAQISYPLFQVEGEPDRVPKTVKEVKKVKIVKDELQAMAELDAPTPTGVTYDQMKAQVLEVAKVKGREASIDLLEPFGVVRTEDGDRKASVSKVKPEDYAAVIAAARKVLA